MSTFDITPKPAFLRAMQAMKWHVTGALAELVDNGFGPGRGDARRVHITHHTRTRTITVLDNGQGMDSIDRLFRLGDTIGLRPGDIGTYGCGGTFALLHLARKFEIWTLRDGLVAHGGLTWRDVFAGETYPEVDNTWHRATIRNTPRELLDATHGTLIKIHLGEGRRFTPSNVKRDLAAMFAPAIRQNRELSWTTEGKGGETSTLAELIPTTDPERSVRFDCVVCVDGVDLPAHGIVGPIDGLPLSRSSVSIGYGPRVITRTKDCYASPDGSERYVGAGVTGWIDLGDGWRPYMTFTKDGIDDSRAWDALMEHVFTRIRDLLKTVETDEIKVEFDNLALNLERAFEGLRNVRVNIVPTDFEGDAVSDGNGITPPKRRTAEPSENEDDPEGQTAAATEIIIEKQTDAQMDGELCRAEVSRSDIVVTVNAEHPAIQEALRATPTNRLMLNMAITREIGEELAASPEIVRKLFPKRALRSIEERDDESSRARCIQRFLMDSVRSGMAS